MTQITNLKELHQELQRLAETNKEEALLEYNRSSTSNLTKLCEGLHVGFLEAGLLVQQLIDYQNQQRSHSPRIVDILSALCEIKDQPGMGRVCNQVLGHQGKHSWENNEQA